MRCAQDFIGKERYIVGAMNARVTIDQAGYEEHYRYFSYGSHLAVPDDFNRRDANSTLVYLTEMIAHAPSKLFIKILYAH